MKERKIPTLIWGLLLILTGIGILYCGFVALVYLLNEIGYTHIPEFTYPDWLEQLQLNGLFDYLNQMANGMQLNMRLFSYQIGFGIFSIGCIFFLSGIFCLIQRSSFLVLQNKIDMLLAK